MIWTDITEYTLFETPILFFPTKNETMQSNFSSLYTHFISQSNIGLVKTEKNGDSFLEAILK